MDPRSPRSQPNTALTQLRQDLSPAGNGQDAALAVASGQSLQRMQTRVTTAVRVAVPRNLEHVKAEVIAECQVDPEGQLYSWSAKNKDGTRSKIEGCSIKMANVLAREYGNCEIDVACIAETETHWLFRAAFIDFETGSTLTREFKQRKPTAGKGLMDLDRTIDIAYQIGQSKAIRNVVVNAMPARVMVPARKAVAKAIEDAIAREGLPKHVKLALTFFERHGVSQQQLEAKIEKPVAKWDKSDLAELRKIRDAIEQGETTPAAEFDVAVQDAGADLMAALTGTPKPAAAAPQEQAPDAATSPGGQGPVDEAAEPSAEDLDAMAALANGPQSSDEPATEDAPAVRGRKGARS